MPSQVKRLLLLFAIAVGILVVVRHFLVPKSFGRYGHYRADAVDTLRAQPIQYAGHLVCQDCHEDIANVKSGSMHADVACEACHGPGYAHTQDPMEHKLVPPQGRKRCSYCHGYSPSRPTGFPQIDSAKHGAGEPCVTCHNPHQPEPPVPVEACEACHAEIARTKSASHHVSLACTTCHGTQSNHALDPEHIRPDKPRTRNFCGQCHAEDAMGPAAAPKVDIATHGEDYLCWQCHYPHYPEAIR